MTCEMFSSWLVCVLLTALVGVCSSNVIKDEGENPVIGEIDDITGDNGDTVGYIWGARKARKGEHGSASSAVNDAVETYDEVTNKNHQGRGFWWGTKPWPEVKQGPNAGAWCQCHDSGCTCCGSHIVRLDGGNVYHIQACGTVDLYDADFNQYVVQFNGNGYPLYLSVMQMDGNNLTRCFLLNGLKPNGNICFHLYNINLSSRRMCLKLVARATVEQKQEEKSMELGCFEIKKSSHLLNDVHESDVDIAMDLMSAKEMFRSLADQLEVDLEADDEDNEALRY